MSCMYKPSSFMVSIRHSHIILFGWIVVNNKTLANFYRSDQL